MGDASLDRNGLVDSSLEKGPLLASTMRILQSWMTDYQHVMSQLHKSWQRLR